MRVLVFCTGVTLKFMGGTEIVLQLQSGPFMNAKCPHLLHGLSE